MQAHQRYGDRGITVIADAEPATGVITAMQHIKHLDDNPDASILVLGRYQSSQAAVGGRTGSHAAPIEFSTVHSAKGREADYVIVLDLKDARYGFPCLVTDDPLLHLVAPPDRDDPFPHAEERRLFYVALTRARKAAYLVSDPVNPSPFVRELMRAHPLIPKMGTVSPQCPSCSRGSMVRSQSGDNLRCTAAPTCNYLAPRCPRCRLGYTTFDGGASGATCTNPNCRHQARICPQCTTGVIVLRTNPSRFWGCSRYWDTPSCTYTELYRPHAATASPAAQS